MASRGSYATVLRGPQIHSATSQSAALAPRMSAPARVAAPIFGDAKPVSWPGRTPTTHSVHGIDVSRWQGTIDWPTARANGVSFAFIKATEGGDRSDPGFEGHWRGAAAAGVPRGAYHFYYFCTSPEIQANWFIANVPRERGALPPVLDMEWNAQSPSCRHRPEPATVRAQAKTFLDILHSHYGQRPIIYITPDFWTENQMWLLQGEEVWLRAVTRHPEEAYPGAAWSFWQYSGTGLVPGINGPVDLNAFAGSPEAWAAWVAARSL
ncbi:glycoside hydrolase [Rubellimicrobium rubrum]|uniref:Glycoside hydrolase n=2 Tax=Rubellimicrobium rubrum TaxID=2585369 RepID=A0A5C4N8E7_9RHOB|nr:glycoside hydrolase [Rubellimicrobium rubrum]